MITKCLKAQKVQLLVLNTRLQKLRPFGVLSEFCRFSNGSILMKLRKCPSFVMTSTIVFVFFITPSSFIPPKGKAKPYLQFQDRPSSWRQCQKGTVPDLLQLFREFTNSQRPSLQFFHCGNLGRYVKNLPTATSIEGATLSNLNATRRRYC